jgi:eukaryotic-like serine/threonine-protein kinase
MGEVYRGRDPRIGRDVAIKVLPTEYAANADRLMRFEQEAKTTGALNHPNLLVIFDIGTHDGSPYLVTELLEGETLRERLERGTVPVRKAIEWTAQIAEGVAAAHQKGVIHRDIKPENIFLSRDERVKLLDFGLAKLIISEEPSGDSATQVRQTEAGTVLGTPGYMAPEQVRGEVVDERADIFALGIVAAELMIGSHPFSRPTRAETMTAILHADVTFPDSAPPGIVRIIDHMLSKDLRSRFQSMQDVAFALRMLSGSHASADSSPRVSAIRGPLADAREFHELTLRRGRISNARFTPDGTIIYGASWEGRAVEMFLATPGKMEPISVGTPGADLLAVSPTGDLAVSLGRTFMGGWVSTGTLARMQIGSSAPRKIRDRVVDADWSPDGKSMAIIRNADDGTFVLEYPIGTVLRMTGGWLSNVRFSRDGTRLAFIDHPWFGDDAGRPVVIDLEGRELMAAEVNSSLSGLCWSSDGSEVWTSAQRPHLGRNIHGYDMAGNERVVLSAPGQQTLHDVRADGAILLTHDTWRREVYSAARGEVAQKNLAWYDWPQLVGIASDGSELLLEEQRATEVGWNRPSFFLRPVDGGPAVHMGNGHACGISPDGAWIAADTGVEGRLELIPTGIGASTFVNIPRFAQLMWWDWFADGKRLWILGAAHDQSRLAMIVPIDGSEATSFGRGDLVWPCAVSPDGEWVVSSTDDGLGIEPAQRSGAVTRIGGTRKGDWVIRFSEDGRYVFVYPQGKTSLTIDRIDVNSGERSVWQEVRPGDEVGIVDIFPIWVTPDGERYAYSYRRCLSDLYLVTMG